MPTVVLIQSDKIVRDVAALLFESAGFTIRAFDDATAVLHEVDWANVDALITEIVLPTPGTSFIHQIQRLRADLPIVVISERLTEEQREALDGLAVQSSFEKPVTFDLLLGAVEHLIDHRSADGDTYAA